MNKIFKWIKKHIPTKNSIEQIRFVRPLLPILRRSPDYWLFTRRSVSWGCAAAGFGAFMPIPFQMIIAILLSLPLRANLIVAVLVLWINNPLTMVPIYLLGYDVGAKILRVPKLHIHFTFTWHWFTHELQHIWEPFFLGCVVCGIILGALLFVIVYFAWKYIANLIHYHHT